MIATIAATVQALMQPSEFDIKVFDKYNHSLEAELIKSMKGSENNFFGTPGGQITTELVTAAISEIPGAATAATAAKSVLMEIVNNQQDNKISLAKSIVNTVERSGAKITIDIIQSKLETLIEQFNFIYSHPDSAAAKINNVQTIFSEIVNLFNVENSIFDKFPEIMSETVLKLSTSYIIFYPVFLKFDREYATKTQTPCTIVDVSEKYRDLYAYYRLTQVKAIRLTYSNSDYPGISTTQECSYCYGNSIYFFIISNGK